MRKTSYSSPEHDTWQLVINTGITIVTFLTVFLVQHTQNRDGIAIQVKLDELIRAVEGAPNNLIDLEDASDAEIEQAKASFNKLRSVVKKGKTQASTSRQPLRRGQKPPKKCPLAFQASTRIRALHVASCPKASMPDGTAHPASENKSFAINTLCNLPQVKSPGIAFAFASVGQ